MSFFEDIRGEDTSQLRIKTKESLVRALSTLENTIDHGFNPYYNVDSHGKSLGHLFYPVFQLVRNAVRLTYSAAVLVGALVSFNGRGIASALGNIVNIILASVVEILNIACSMISLVTRTLATIFNCGYSDKNLTPEQRHIQKMMNDIDNYPAPTNCVRRHAQTFRKDLATQFDATTTTLWENEKEIHKTAFTLV